MNLYKKITQQVLDVNQKRHLFLDISVSTHVRIIREIFSGISRKKIDDLFFYRYLDWALVLDFQNTRRFFHLNYMVDCKWKCIRAKYWQYPLNINWQIAVEFPWYKYSKIQHTTNCIKGTTCSAFQYFIYANFNYYLSCIDYLPAVFEFSNNVEKIMPKLIIVIEYNSIKMKNIRVRLIVWKKLIENMTAAINMFKIVNGIK